MLQLRIKPSAHPPVTGYLPSGRPVELPPGLYRATIEQAQRPDVAREGPDWQENTETDYETECLAVTVPGMPEPVLILAEDYDSELCDLPEARGRFEVIQDPEQSA